MAYRLEKITKQFTTAATNLQKFIDQELERRDDIRADILDLQSIVATKDAEIARATSIKTKIEELLS